MSKDEIIDNLDLLMESIRLIEDRFSKIQVPDDFVLGPEGIILLDAIVMRLQVVGELVKQMQKASPIFLQHYTEIEWDKIARFRDLVSHHYEQVDHEIVYDICKAHIPKLSEMIQKMALRFRKAEF